nr:hypothetical protein [Clostridia bacterium]
MKRRICLILAIILLFPALLLGYGMSLPSYYAQAYYAQLTEMLSKLQNAGGKKIIIVGGSNVAFGVNSADLEDTLRQRGFDYTVCNFGLYAAVGTSAMLSLSEDAIGEGDIVVLAIEPTPETFSTYFGATAMLKCAEDHPEMLLRLNSQQKTAVVGNYIDYLQERAEIRRSGILPRPEGVYTKAAFDENGDMVYERAGNSMLLGYDTAVPIDLAAFTSEAAFARQVNEYIAAAREKGAQVVMSFSPMNRTALVDASEETVYGFYQYLLETFNCAIISDPNDYIMDSGWFYDSNFHLNSAGAAIRTHQLCCDLLTWLGSSAAVAFEMPQMPASIAVVEETTADSGDFLYQMVGESGLEVCGLTAQGLEKQQLIVPGMVEGKAVVGITEDAFAGNAALEELTLPATIERIPDGAFDGCVNLKRLTLLHRDKTPTVGAGFLDGAPDLIIHVPAEAYPLYRDGAGCAANSWENYLDRIVTIAP